MISESDQKKENAPVFATYRGNIRRAYEEEITVLSSAKDIEGKGYNSTHLRC